MLIGVMLLWAILTGLTTIVFRIWDRVERLESALTAFRDAAPKQSA
jgi:hypothetical protein